ncbi:MAG: hypothetical protein M0R17_10495 [Candidatus Omnitrophica bacterium]|jgi:hypothetical protein|nr:hypothetical protein [Candidatus Omnitrophota bacterium]MDD5252566.1 hypothetical protein [Candidatus Omnitrophota bacterium]
MKIKCPKCGGIAKFINKAEPISYGDGIRVPIPKEWSIICNECKIESIGGFTPQDRLIHRFILIFGVLISCCFLVLEGLLFEHFDISVLSGWVLGIVGFIVIVLVGGAFIFFRQLSEWYLWRRVSLRIKSNRNFQVPG